MQELLSSKTQVYHDPSGQARPFLTPLAPGEFLLVLDNSSLERWKRCPMAFRNYAVLRRDGHARNAALTFGGAIHSGLEKFYLGETVDEQDKAIVRYFANNPAPDDEYRTPMNALEVMRHYRTRATFPDYQDETLEDTSGLLIERPFEIPLGVLEVNDWLPVPRTYDVTDLVTRIVAEQTQILVNRVHVAWSGRMDRITRSADGGPNRVQDHKTSSIDGEQFVQSFQLASQTLGYVWAANQLWPEHNITGFCLNVLRLKRPGKGQGLTDKGARGGEAPLAFFRAYFDYSPERLRRWASDTLCSIEDAMHCAVRNEWPLNDRHCFDKFGRCPYWDACTIDDEVVRERFLQSDAFAQVTWNPVHAR